MTKKFLGRNEGLIDGQQYLSFTEAEVSDAGVLSGIFRMEKCPTTFHPAYLSLSNASSKSSCYAWSHDSEVMNFSSVVGNQGKISSARIYSFPDYPGCLLTQVGDAELTPEGMCYHTLINGFTAGMPTDPVAIDPYQQTFTRAGDGSLRLETATRIHLKSGGLIRSVITGQFSFPGIDRLPSEFFVKYSPVFKTEGMITTIDMAVELSKRSLLLKVA